MSNIAVAYALLFSFAFASCQQIKPKTKGTSKLSSNIIKEKTQVIKPSQSEYHPSRTLKFDLLHTKLELTPNWTTQQMNGIATLTLKPYFYSQNTLELDAKGMDVPKVQLVNGTNLSDLKFNYDKKKITIMLDRTYTRKDTIQVRIEYTSKPNELPKGGSAAITEDKGLYFINADGSDKDKPKQIWTQGETEASSAWFPTIDSPNERTTQEMYITVDTVYEVLSNGEHIYSKNNGNGTKTSYWKQDKTHAPYLFMMAVGEFAIVEDTMPTGKDWKDLEIKYYVEPKYEPYAKDIFGNTPEMINFFSELLNYRYPWSKYSQIVVRDYVSGAMENTTATIFMEALQVDDRELLDKNWDGIIAHELFHHWFGDLVTSESWSNLPLNESFANYSEYLWAEHKYGVDEADYLGEKEKEEYYVEAATKQEPLIRYHYKDREDMFDRHSYNKGGRVLHMLRKLVGDEAFFTSLNQYLRKNEYTSVEIHDLRLALEDVTGVDYNWFFNQWFLSPGHPELTVSHSYNSGVLKFKILQTHDTTYTPVYRIPLKVEVWANGQKNTHNITLTKANQEFTIPVAYMPQMVNIDADNSLLAIINHKKSKEELIFQYYNSERYLNRYAALEELFTPITNGTEKAASPFSDPKLRELLGKALEDKFWAIREFALSQFSKFPIPEVEIYMKKLEQIAISDSKPETRARAIYLLSSFDNKAYKHVYEKGLTERPYSIVGASLSSYLKTGPSDATTVAQEHEKYDNLNIILALGDYYTDVKDKSKYAWFKNNMNTGDAQKLYNFMNAFGQYLMVIDGPEKEDGKKILEKIALENKHEVIRETAKVYLQYLK